MSLTVYKSYDFCYLVVNNYFSKNIYILKCPSKTKTLKEMMTMKFRCLDCRYKFSPKTERLPNRCPFCGSSSIKKDETAQDVLDEVGHRQIPDA